MISQGKILPEIQLAIEDEGWAEETSLRPVVEQAVAAAIGTAKLRFEPGSELSLLFTSDAGVRRLNREWRNVDKATNVLSFPGRDVTPRDIAGPLLGDIVLARETVGEEASLEHKKFEHHLSHLIVHGLLHLFGYDHANDEDAAIMESIEQRALAQLGIANPYG